MDKERIVINLSQQLEEVARRIGSLSADISIMKGDAPQVSESYEEFLLDAVAHLQIITLSLTQIVTEDGEEEPEGAVEEEEAEGDDGMFRTGELEDKKEDEEKPEEPLDKEET